MRDIPDEIGVPDVKAYRVTLSPSRHLFIPIQSGEHRSKLLGIQSPLELRHHVTAGRRQMVLVALYSPDDH